MTSSLLIALKPEISVAYVIRPFANIPELAAKLATSLLPTIAFAQLGSSQGTTLTSSVNPFAAVTAFSNAEWSASLRPEIPATKSTSPDAIIPISSTNLMIGFSPTNQDAMAVVNSAFPISITAEAKLPTPVFTESSTFLHPSRNGLMFSMKSERSDPISGRFKPFMTPEPKPPMSRPTARPIDSARSPNEST